ncbi:MAG TPA: hypothetical protein VG186_09490 [Solirubrobacteraceae bacterium]|nr:hypothetical protein [Solirubrobacteraceae bacterium]
MGSELLFETERLVVRDLYADHGLDLGSEACEGLVTLLRDAGQTAVRARAVARNRACRALTRDLGFEGDREQW